MTIFSINTLHSLVTCVAVAGGALVGGGGGLEHLQGVPQDGAGVRASMAACLGARVSLSSVSAAHQVSLSLGPTVHHGPLVLPLDGGAQAEEGGDQEDQEGSHLEACEVERRLC